MQGTRVEGAVLVVEVKLAVNLVSLTIEQVIGKRKQLLQDMAPGLEAEARQASLCEPAAARRSPGTRTCDRRRASRRRGARVARPKIHVRYVV